MGPALLLALLSGLGAAKVGNSNPEPSWQANLVNPPRLWDDSARNAIPGGGAATDRRYSAWVSPGSSFGAPSPAQG